MGEMAKEYGIVYRDKPPYEVLYTKWISYPEMIRLKGVEEMTEVYYNSGQFETTLEFIYHLEPSMFQFFEKLSGFYEGKGYKGQNLGRVKKYEILYDFIKECYNKEIAEAGAELLTFDMYLRERLKTRPKFAANQEEYKKAYKACLTSVGQFRKVSEQVHIEHFTIDIKETARTGLVILKNQFAWFDYTEKLKHKRAAKVIFVESLKEYEDAPIRERN